MARMIDIRGLTDEQIKDLAAREGFQAPVKVDADFPEKQLTLNFSKNGASLKFQTQDEMNNSADFVKLDGKANENVSMPIDTPPYYTRDTKGLKVSKTYTDILNDPVMDKIVYEYESRSAEEQRLQDRILDKKIRQGYRKKSTRLRDINLFFALRENNYKNADFQAYLAQVTKQLELEGLWREESAESLESDSFPIDDLRDEDLDRDFEPKSLVKIYDTRFAPSMKDSLAELEEEGIEWEDELSFNHSDLPQFTTPTVHNLWRRPPWGLYETITRKLTEGSFFSKHPDIDNLFMCAYFVSKSIFTRSMFIQVKYEAFAGTPLQKKFRTYSFRRFLADQKSLEKLTNEALKNYFQNNSTIRDNLSKNANENLLTEKEINSKIRSIWQRFFEIQKTLTKKQRTALELVYTNDPRLTYEQAANKEQISKDSFQDRITGAVKKFKDAMPELDGLKTPSTYLKNKELNLLYNGLFCKDSAKKIRPLYWVDPDTNEKIEIPFQRLEPNLNGPNHTAIRAWSIVSTPVPDIMYTDFFMGLVPDGHIRRLSGKSKFRG